MLYIVSNAMLYFSYELQVNSKYQSSGIGAWVMNLLHQIAKQSRMEKVSDEYILSYISYQLS